MEFLLLWIDELDDALSTLRHYLPEIVGFLVALALFAATGAALVMAPQISIPIGGVVLSASLLEMARRRRSKLSARRNTD